MDDDARSTGRVVAWAALVVADLAAVGTLAPHASLWHRLAHPHRWLAAVGADAAAAELAGVALWLVAVWLCAGLLAGAGARLPGACGQVADRIARAVLPRAVYRLAAGAAGLGIVLSPLNPIGAAASTPSATGNPPVAVAHLGHETPDWPIGGPAQPRSPRWPTSPPTGRAGRTGAEPAGRPSAVVVRPGDSLWRIAAEHLPAGHGARRVAVAWPRWYAANRRVIGADPDLVRPGEVLHPPTEGPHP